MQQLSLITEANRRVPPGAERVVLVQSVGQQRPRAGTARGSACHHTVQRPGSRCVLKKTN